jgi:ABC-type branched-subunit amino acid transport system substrate-binding protein
VLETVPAIVAEAIAVGAVAGLGDTAKQAVTDAYEKLKALVLGCVGASSVESLEQQPDSVARRSVLVEDLQRADAEGDQELLAAAQALLAVVRAHEVAAGAAVGVDLERVSAAALRVREVESTGTGVRVVEGTFVGDIEIGSVKAGRTKPQDPSSARR